MHRIRYASLQTTCLTLLALACLLVLPQQTLAQQKQARSFSDVQRGLPVVATDVSLQTEPAPAVSKTAALNFYTSRATFEADFPDLTEEDFEGSNFPPGSVGTCPGPLNSGASGCYPAGELEDGFALGATPIGEIVILTPGVIGASTLAGPNFFDDDSVLDFTGPDDVFAVGFELNCPLGAATMDIEIIGPGGSLGTTTSPCAASLGGTFFGVASDTDPITSIEVTNPASAGELYDNLAFGGKIEVDLAVAKSGTGSAATGLGRFHVSVTNNGTLNATGVVVDDALPLALTVTGWTQTKGTFDAFSGLWDVGTLAPGESADLWIDVRFDAEGLYCNTSTVSGDQDDPNPDNNEAEACLLIFERGPDPDFTSGQGPGGILGQGARRFSADLAVTKTADVEEAANGDEVTWTITVNNNGPNTTAGVEVTDQLPECLSLASTTASQGSVDDDGVWSVGKLRVGQSATLTVVTTLEDCSDEVTNEVSITGSNLPDPDDLFNVFDEEPESDNSASATVSVSSASARRAEALAQLRSNYPNPFNPETVIPFELARPAHVTVQVYDLLGRLVDTLVDGERAAGVHEVVFRGEQLPTGMYLVRMEAAGRVYTQRITLMK